MPFLNFINVFL